MPLEKQALLLIREAYHGEYPASYRISDSTRTVSLSPALEIQLLQVVDVDGVGLRLKKYLAKSLSEGSIAVSEQLFLSSSISNSILAVAVDNHTLEPNQSTMVFVVDQKEREK
jgi:conjugal transfer pilus assembly protein TraK